MAEKEAETKADRAWSWICRIAGLSVFVYSATLDNERSYGMAFLGICVALFPATEMRILLRRWRGANGSGNDRSST